MFLEKSQIKGNKFKISVLAIFSTFLVFPVLWATLSKYIKKCFN